MKYKIKYMVKGNVNDVFNVIMSVKDGSYLPETDYLPLKLAKALFRNKVKNARIISIKKV